MALTNPASRARGTKFVRAEEKSYSVLGISKISTPSPWKSSGSSVTTAVGRLMSAAAWWTISRTRQMPRFRPVQTTEVPVVSTLRMKKFRWSHSSALTHMARFPVASKTLAWPYQAAARSLPAPAKSKASKSFHRSARASACRSMAGSRLSRASPWRSRSLR